MKNGILGCLAVVIWLTSQRPVDAVLIDVSEVTFTDFEPNPIEPGQRPTTFGYRFEYDKESNDAVSAGFDFTVTFSSNATYGDSDDKPLGTRNGALQSVAGVSGSRSETTFNPSGHAFFQVPVDLLPGQYNAFLFITPRSPHFDPDTGDALGQLPGFVTVGIPPEPNLDYNTDGAVNTADYTVWRDTLGATGPGLAADGNANNTIDAGDYAVWQAAFGQTTGTASTSNVVPEPRFMALLVAAMAAGAFVTRVESSEKILLEKNHPF
jgi:hypothetical protein